MRHAFDSCHATMVSLGGFALQVLEKQCGALVDMLSLQQIVMKRADLMAPMSRSNEINFYEKQPVSLLRHWKRTYA